MMSHIIQHNVIISIIIFDKRNNLNCIKYKKYSLHFPCVMFINTVRR